MDEVEGLVKEDENRGELRGSPHHGDIKAYSSDKCLRCEMLGNQAQWGGRISSPFQTANPTIHRDLPRFCLHGYSNRPEADIESNFKKSS
ncbi:hypothetical protein P7K49_016983 [Saguinus oedipus]|uniref:Uncharacterized protein n=1 Tax=Saguinus oedipus TaxID=9490 RepID=A0ABQ9V193_SAGOE|nr:hypothetical protein P7K49_016983 [Saguinus oedipus]